MQRPAKTGPRAVATTPARLGTPGARPRLLDAKESPMDHTEIMHYIAQAAINITEGVPGPIEQGSPIHKALIALCEEESRKEHFVELRLFGHNGDADTGRRTESGPFTSRAEAERTLRGAMTTGRFVAGTIVTKEKQS